MTDAPSPRPPPPRRVDWSALAAVVATLVGLLALVVSAYTANLQRQQVRAQVWPRLMLAWSGARHELMVINKGVGPAQVRSVRFAVDGKPQRDWKSLTQALLGAPLASGDYAQSTISDAVVTPGETVTMLAFTDAAAWSRFRAESPRFSQRICFCSTLDECWIVQQPARDADEQYRKADRCDRNEAEEFNE